MTQSEDVFTRSQIMLNSDAQPGDLRHQIKMLLIAKQELIEIIRSQDSKIKLEEENRHLLVTEMVGVIAQMEALSSEVDRLKSELESVETERKELEIRASHDIAEAVSSERRASVNSMDEMSAQMEALSSEVDRLKSELETVSSERRASATRMVEMTAQMTAQLTGFSLELQFVRDELGRVEQVKRQLEFELQSARETANETSRKADVAGDTVVTIRKDLVQLEGRAKKAEACISSLISTLRSTVDTVASESDGTTIVTNGEISLSSPESWTNYIQELFRHQVVHVQRLKAEMTRIGDELKKEDEIKRNMQYSHTQELNVMQSRLMQQQVVINKLIQGLQTTQQREQELANFVYIYDMKEKLREFHGERDRSVDDRSTIVHEDEEVGVEATERRRIASDKLFEDDRSRQYDHQYRKDNVIQKHINSSNYEFYSKSPEPNDGNNYYTIRDSVYDQERKELVECIRNLHYRLECEIEEKRVIEEELEALRTQYVDSNRLLAVEYSSGHKADFMRNNITAEFDKQLRSFDNDNVSDMNMNASESDVRWTTPQSQSQSPSLSQQRVSRDPWSPDKHVKKLRQEFDQNDILFAKEFEDDILSLQSKLHEEANLKRTVIEESEKERIVLVGLLEEMRTQLDSQLEVRSLLESQLLYLKSHMDLKLKLSSPRHVILDENMRVDDGNDNECNKLKENFNDLYEKYEQLMLEKEQQKYVLEEDKKALLIQLQFAQSAYSPHYNEEFIQLNEHVEVLNRQLLVEVEEKSFLEEQLITLESNDRKKSVQNSQQEIIYLNAMINDLQNELISVKDQLQDMKAYNACLEHYLHDENCNREILEVQLEDVNLDLLHLHKSSDNSNHNSQEIIFT
eukprot:gene3840-7647_t